MPIDTETDEEEEEEEDKEARKTRRMGHFCSAQNATAKPIFEGDVTPTTKTNARACGRGEGRSQNREKVVSAQKGGLISG